MSYNSLLINKVDLFDETIDQWGQPTETETSGVVCRIMYKTKLIRNFQGEEVLSFAKLFFKPGQTINHSTRVRITGPQDGKKIKHPIISITRPQNSTILHHNEIWIS